MIAASGLRWILSLVFAVPVLYGVWLMVLPGTGMAERVDHALHSAMGVLMIAMAWPWGMDIPAAPQVVLFSVGGLWFVAAAPFRAGDRTWGRAELAALPHVVMMGATIGTWAEAYGPEEGVYASLFAFSQEAADRLEGSPRETGEAPASLLDPVSSIPVRRTSRDASGHAPTAIS